MVLQRAVKLRSLEREIKRLRDTVEGRNGKRPELLGESRPMRQLASLLDRIGDSTASVLITGESGTGKELVARALHAQSRPDGAFVAINCAAMPESLLESELFGHVRGAFTDAKSDHEGLFRLSSGG